MYYSTIFPACTYSCVSRGILLTRCSLLLLWRLQIVFGGFLMANIVTTTHQSEELMFEHEHDWVASQFLTTRNAVTSNPFSEWIWGGMQYQLEHHLVS